MEKWPSQCQTRAILGPESGKNFCQCFPKDTIMISNQIKFEKDWFENGLPSLKIGVFKFLGSLGKIFDLPIVQNDPRASTFQAKKNYANWPNGLGGDR